MAISVVFAGRDPTHAGNLMSRVKLAFERNLHESAGVNVDWVFVEWNPTEQLISPWLAKRGVRCFIVPNEIHREIVHPDLVNTYHFMDGFANNVGARRAKHEWVIITNNDAIFGRNIWHFIRNEDLDKTLMYRAERRDVPFRFFGRSFNTMEHHKSKVYSTHRKQKHAAGSFMMISMQVYPGYDERIRDTNVHADGHLCWNWIKHLQYRLRVIGKIYKADHELVLRKVKGQTVTEYKGRRKSTSGIIYNKTYDNTLDWGLSDYSMEEVEENIWRIGK